MVFPSPTPFTNMAIADYSPYPLHTVSASTTPQRQNNPSSLTTPLSENRPAKRVDSGLEPISQTSSITFTPEVERKLALQEFLHHVQRYRGMRNQVEEREGWVFDDDAEWELGLRAVDSIDINAGRASTWEDKEVRARRNSKSGAWKAKKLRKWVRKLLGYGW